MAERLPERPYVPIRRVLKNVGHTATQSEVAGSGEATRLFRPVSGMVEKVSRDSFNRIGYVHLWIQFVRGQEPGLTHPPTSDQYSRRFCHIGAARWWQSEEDHRAWKALPADPETGRAQKPVGRTDFEPSDCAIVVQIILDEKVATAEGGPLPDDVKAYLLALAPPKQGAV